MVLYNNDITQYNVKYISLNIGQVHKVTDHFVHVVDRNGNTVTVLFFRPIGARQVMMSILRRLSLLST